jgi:predicted ferric reductase
MCALIAVTMLRKTLTFLRSHGGADYFPVDHHIFFHQFSGWLIFILGLVHTMAHLVNIGMFTLL